MERVINTRDSCLHFLNRSIPFFPKTEICLKPREQRFIKIDVPFIDKISGLVIIKILELKTDCTNTIKVQLIRNTGFLDVTGNSLEQLLFSKDEALGTADLRSIGYHKVKQSSLQLHLKPYYELKS